MMTVGEMKKILATYADEMPVVMAKDAEGNDFSPLANVDGGLYEPNSTWSGDVYADEDEGEATKKAFRTVVLWPVN